MPETEQQKVNRTEDQESEYRTSVRARIVLEAIRRDGQEELARSPSALAWSGLAAGLAMGLSLLAEGALRAHLPEEPWRPLIAKLGYSLGFLIVIIGKQQLFTENTLTPIVPVLHNKDVKTIIDLLRLWAIVLLANLTGAFLVAWFFAWSPAVTTEVHKAMFETALEATRVDPWTAFVRGIPAGWLIAMVVWLRAATESGEVPILIILTYFIALPGFTHVVAGSVEYLYVVMAGSANAVVFLRDYFLPVLVGNVIGGATLVAGLNHAQVVTEKND